MKILHLLLVLPLFCGLHLFAQDAAKPAAEKAAPADDIEALVEQLKKASEDPGDAKAATAIAQKIADAAKGRAELAEKAAPAAEAQKAAEAKKPAGKPVAKAPGIKIEIKGAVDGGVIEIDGEMLKAAPGKPLVIRPAIGRAQAIVQVAGVPRPVVPLKKVELKDFVMPENFLRGPNDKTFINLNEGAPETAPKDELRFMDGGKLTGEFRGISKDGKRLSWTNQYAAAPIEFGINGIAYAKLNPDEDKAAKRDLTAEAAVQFMNGDRIVGKILSMTDEKLVLETWYAGKLEIERAMIKAVNPVSSRALVMYAGPDSIEGWVHGPNNNAWRVRAGDLEATKPGSIGLNLPDEPDRVRLKFKARWTGYTTYNVAFCASDVTAAGGNYYKMSIRSGSFTLSRVTAGASPKSLWNFHNSQFSSSRGKAGYVYEILYDRKKKTFTLVVDGKVLKQWTETEKELVSKKNGIFFSSDNSNSSVKISEIEVTHWDGKVPRSGEVEEPEEGIDSVDQVFFVNGDRLMGTVQGLDKGMLQLKTEIGDVPVPVANVIEIGFAEENIEQARRNLGDIRATFAGIYRSAITVKLLGMADGKVRGYSEHFGEIEMPMDVFSRIEFNIYDAKLEEEDEDLYPF